MTQLIGFIFTALLLQSVHAQDIDGRDQRLAMNVYFKHMATTASSTQLQRFLDDVDIVRKSRSCPLEVVIVIGHADISEGNQKEIQELSKKRALYIERQLNNEGIPSTHVAIFSQGATTPIVAPSDQRNARVEVKFNGTEYSGQPCDDSIGDVRRFRLSEPRRTAIDHVRN